MQTARSAFIPDHEWAVVDKHVGDATDCPVLAEGRPEEAVGEGRDESAGGLRCDSGAADSGSAFTALPLNVKVITGP